MIDNTTRSLSTLDILAVFYRRNVLQCQLGFVGFNLMVGECIWFLVLSNMPILAAAVCGVLFVFDIVAVAVVFALLRIKAPFIENGVIHHLLHDSVPPFFGELGEMFSRGFCEFGDFVERHALTLGLIGFCADVGYFGVLLAMYANDAGGYADAGMGIWLFVNLIAVSFIRSAIRKSKAMNTIVC